MSVEEIRVEILRDNLAHAASFSLVGIALLVIGFAALDLVTPGKLRDLVWIERNGNAVILAASMVLGLSLVLVASVISTGEQELWRGLVYSAAYGVLTIAVMMWSFVLIDWLTPGRLGTVLLAESAPNRPNTADPSTDDPSTDDPSTDAPHSDGTRQGNHPAGWITGAVFVGIGAIVAATLVV